MHFNLREKKHRHNETPSKSAHTKEKMKKIVQSVNSAYTRRTNFVNFFTSLHTYFVKKLVHCIQKNLLNLLLDLKYFVFHFFQNILCTIKF